MAQTRQDRAQTVAVMIGATMVSVAMVAASFGLFAGQNIDLLVGAIVWLSMGAVLIVKAEY